MFGDVVLGIPKKKFEEILRAKKNLSASSMTTS
jgi:hypothetical protein